MYRFSCRYRLRSLYGRTSERPFPTMTRNIWFPDFLVGLIALPQEDTFIWRARGFYRRYFPKLRIIDLPSEAHLDGRFEVYARTPFAEIGTHTDVGAHNR